jgi:hypothetical protein
MLEFMQIAPITTTVSSELMQYPTGVLERHMHNQLILQDEHGGNMPSETADFSG